MQLLRKTTSSYLNKRLDRIIKEQSIPFGNSSIIESFGNNTLPFHFGFSALNRDDLIENHTTKITQELIDVRNSLFLTWDGTYA